MLDKTHILFAYVLWSVTSVNYIFCAFQYEISDDLGVGRKFDGIGGLSGGGPKFGASLQILKVEIGGDDQTTDGTEASHMHEEWDQNYNRGYEWWLMLEAKKRNPNIKLYGLSWAWPHWLGNNYNQPYKDLNKTALYIVNWINGAKTQHGLTIDYIGMWNERDCNSDYLLTLRRALDAKGFQNVQIIACDSWWDAFGGISSNKTVSNSIYAFGVHYPGTISPQAAITSNITLWSSEDYSTFNDEVGGGCWARILNQNYVNGYMTSTIAWNLIASYYFGLPYEGDGLMTAVEPWSGYYELKSPIWISAHTTQFTQIGWHYLKHGHGVGLLDKGGSYVSLVNDDSKQLTIVIETMTRNHSICIRPYLPYYNLTKQKAIFKFGGSFSQLKKMFLWKTQLKYDGTPSTWFQYNGSVQVNQGRIALSLDVDSIYTLTTVADGNHGDFGEIPKSAPFPLPYEDTFQQNQLNEEPYNLAPQIGSWEILEDSTTNRKFARQTVLAKPVTWCNDPEVPTAIIGNQKWTDVSITATVRLPEINGTDSVFLATRIQCGDCGVPKPGGLFFWINKKFSTYVITTDINSATILDLGMLDYKLKSDQWYNITLSVKGSAFVASVNNQNVTQFSLPSNLAANGFAAVGGGSFGYCDIGYLKISAV